jgi:tetratricopeptide (TPR) repeat protein
MVRQLALFSLLVVEPPAAAQTRESSEDPKLRAEEKVAEAERLYEAADYGRSLERLIEARALFASPLLYFNFGLTYRGLGRDRDALGAFERFLAETSDRQSELAAPREEAAWHVDALRMRLRPVVLSPPLGGATTPAAALRSAPVEPLIRAGLAPVYRRWWFWTAVGAVAAAAITTWTLWPRPTPSVCWQTTCRLGEYTLK